MNFGDKTGIKNLVYPVTLSTKNCNNGVFGSHLERADPEHL